MKVIAALIIEEKDLDEGVSHWANRIPDRLIPFVNKCEWVIYGRHVVKAIDVTLCLCTNCKNERKAL